MIHERVIQMTRDAQGCNGIRWLHDDICISLARYSYSLLLRAYDGVLKILEKWYLDRRGGIRRFLEPLVRVRKLLSLHSYENVGWGLYRGAVRDHTPCNTHRTHPPHRYQIENERCARSSCQCTRLAIAWLPYCTNKPMNDCAIWTIDIWNGSWYDCIIKTNPRTLHIDNLMNGPAIMRRILWTNSNHWPPSSLFNLCKWRMTLPTPSSPVTSSPTCTAPLTQSLSWFTAN